MKKMIVFFSGQCTWVNSHITLPDFSLFSLCQTMENYEATCKIMLQTEKGFWRQNFYPDEYRIYQL